MNIVCAVCVYICVSEREKKTRDEDKQIKTVFSKHEEKGWGDRSEGERTQEWGPDFRSAAPI